IRVYGPVPDWAALAAAVKAEFKGKAEVQLGASSDTEATPAVIRSDLLIFFVAPDGSWPTIKLIKRVIHDHGAWSYLPAVVVGEPTHTKHRQFLARLGASRYLPAQAKLAEVAREARTVLQATWWTAECESDLPAFVVNQ